MARMENKMSENIGNKNIITKRDKLVDALKGYACFLVVFGHVIMGIRKAGMVSSEIELFVENFIWTFHVALFMFLSGYVYNITGGCNKKGGKGKFFLHKLLNLGVPYIFFSVVYIVMNSLIPGTNHDSSLIDIFLIWKKPTAQYWFLYALIMLFACWILFSGSLKNWQITVLMVCFAICSPFLGVKHGSFAYSINMCFAFGIGSSLDKLYFDKIKWYFKLLAIIIHLFVVGIAVYVGIQDVIGVKYLVQLLGIVASIAFISWMTECNVINQCLLFINKYSFPIYLLHTIFTAAIRIFMKKIGITNYALLVIMSLIVGIFIPVGIAWITDKIPVFDFFFYPSKNIKRLQKRDK